MCRGCMKSRQISDMRGPGSGRRHRETLIFLSLPLESAMFDCMDCNFQTCFREESTLQAPQASVSKLRTSQVRHTTFARKKATNKYCFLDSLSACDFSAVWRLNNYMDLPKRMLKAQKVKKLVAKRPVCSTRTFSLIWLSAKPFKYRNCLDLIALRACLQEGGGPQVGEVTCGGSPHLSCKCDRIKKRDCMDRQVTSPTWGPPPPPPFLNSVKFYAQASNWLSWLNSHVKS